MSSPDWDAEPAPTPPAPIEQLQSEAELLRIIAYWRTEAERWQDYFDWLRRKRKLKHPQT